MSYRSVPNLSISKYGFFKFGDSTLYENDFQKILDSGDLGDKGEIGATGASGASGTQGEKGESGTAGPSGTQGEKGEKGESGTVGETGAVGPTGESGEQPTARSYSVTTAGGYYYIDDVQQDSLHLIRGQKYIFNLNVSGHPFVIQSSSTSYNSANVYNSGITNNGATTGSLTFIVPYDAPDTLYYVCQYHSGMGGSIEIVNLSGDDLKGEKGEKGEIGTAGPTGSFDTFNDVTLGNHLFVANDVSFNSKLYVENDLIVGTEELSFGSLKGSQIDGLIAGEYTGFSVSINSDGTIVAIGAYSNDDAYSNAGTTRIYEWNGSDWALKGNQINGLMSDERSGFSVSLNDDGTIIAIGAYRSGGRTNDNWYTDEGATRIYQWDGNDWALKGNQINGITEGEYSGYSVSINSDGTIVAIGAYPNDEAYSNAGTTRIYQWDGNDWALKGNQINGLTEGENSGRSVSINSDGTIVAIGAYYYNVGDIGFTGTTRIYEWDDSDWVLKGNQINGLSREFSGNSVSINSYGTIVAIGADRFDEDRGTTYVYEWDGNDWALKGNQIDGLAAGEYSGRSVSINSDGTIVVIGAYSNDGAYTNAGTTRIYEWNGSDWVLKVSYNGVTEGEFSGSSVSINSDGTSVAIGAYGYNSSTGCVRVYGSTSTPSGNLYVTGDISLNSRLYIQNTDILTYIQSLESRIQTLEGVSTTGTIVS